VTRFVVDASVATKWYLPESDTAAAERLLRDEHELIVPDLLFAEVGNALWKRWHKGEITPSDVRAAVSALEAAPLRIEPSRLLIKAGSVISIKLRWPIYDCLYLALAERESCELVTADRKFYGAAAKISGLARLSWLGEEGA
jgi:predicted nucleic acid-binding protein